MIYFRRNFAPRDTYFFTLALRNLKSQLLTSHTDLLGETFRKVKQKFKEKNTWRKASIHSFQLQQWQQVDLEDKSIHILLTKNHETHTLPLSDFLCDLLTARKENRINDYVFPANGAAGHIIEPRKQMAQVTKATGIEFTVHDLRRTFITIAESLDIPAYALKRLMNHTMTNDVTAG